MAPCSPTAKAITPINEDYARSPAGGNAGTNKIQSLAEEPVAPSRVGPPKPFPGSSAVGGHGQPAVLQIAYRGRHGNYAL
jgi:Na+-translocating ferredoxin:NAD+ oxidoreductase RNF subunit RnfB